MNTIKINSHFEDFIWMSYRYCIGRKTIAANMHADTIANFIYKNPNIFKETKIITNIFSDQNDMKPEINYKTKLEIPQTCGD